MSDALADVEAWSRQASIEEIAVACDEIFRFADAFGIPRGDTEVPFEYYCIALSHLPADIIAGAVMKIIKEWRWGNRLPLPADILSAVDKDDVQHRQRHYTSLLRALPKLRQQRAEASRVEVSAPDPVTKGDG